MPENMFMGCLILNGRISIKSNYINYYKSNLANLINIETMIEVVEEDTIDNSNETNKNNSSKDNFDLLMNTIPTTQNNKLVKTKVKKADTVILCPIYRAGENIKLGFSYNNFAKKIIKNSKVKLILIKNNLDLIKYVKQNIYGNKIAIGMGAGSISNWIRDLPKYIK